MRTKNIQTIARILLGVVLVVFGLNGFLQFMPTPPMAEPAAGFIGAILATGYLMPLVKIIEIGVGVLLLTNRFVPLALVVLAPISVNIVGFHLFLDVSGIGPAALVMLLNIYLLWAQRDHFEPVLRARASRAPSAVGA
ncbi:MAG: DoxX family protein [Rhodothermales bacterium]